MKGALLMKKWKKTAAFILMFVMVVLTAGCGAGGKTQSESTAAPSEASAAESAVTESSAAESQPEADAQQEKRILVVETTDIHGWIVDASSGDPETFAYRLARIADAVNELRASGEYDDVLLLDGGDLYQGPPVSNLLYGAPIRAVMDAMGYDAVGLGNHELDWDVVQYCADEEGTVAPYELGEYAGDPDIPVVASNLYDAETGERVSFAKDYIITEKAGLKIAVIGWIPDYSIDIMTEKIAPYRIDEDTDKLDALVREVKEKEAPDAVIVLAHEKPKPIAEAMDSSLVDLVLGGHSHKVVTETADNGIPCLQANCYAQGYGTAVMVVGADGSVSVEDLTYTDISEDAEALYDTEENLDNLDETVMDISYVAWNAVWEEMSEVLGYVDTPIEKVKKVGANSAGNWITSLMLRATAEDGAIMAFYNNGGIRTSFEIPEGETTRNITVGDIYTITPFSNKLLVYDLTGPELAELLKDGLVEANYGDQMSGLTFTYSATGDESMDRAEREYTILSITLDDGTEVDLADTEKTYRVCTSSYNASLEDSVYVGKEPIVAEVDAPIDQESFIEVLRQESAENEGHLAVDTGTRGVEVAQ